MMPMLLGIPVHMSPWVDKPKYIRSIGLIVKDEAMLQEVLDFANSDFYKTRESIGDRCADELLTLYAMWKANGASGGGRY